MTRRLVLAAVLLVLVLVFGATRIWFRDDDRPVDASTPEVLRVTAVAQEVVAGRVLAVARDEDDGKWEITIDQAGQTYEVELSPVDLSLLRIDYRTEAHGFSG